MKGGARLRSLLATVLLCVAFHAHAQRFAVTNNGDWNNPGTWASTGCGGASGATVPTLATAVTICNDRTINVNGANGSAASIVFENGNRDSTINVNAGRTLTVAGNVSITASNNNTLRTISVNSGATLAVQGNVTLDSNANNNRQTDLVVNGGAAASAATITGTLTLQDCDADSTATVRLVNANATLTVDGTVTVTSTGCSISNGPGMLNFNGAFTIAANGTFSNNTGTTNLGGNLTHTGTLNANTGTFNFTGGAPQQLLGTAATTTLYNMGMNNAAGLTLSHNVQVSRQLTLTAGTVATGTNSVIVTPNCNTGAPNQPVVRVAGWVNGNLRKTFPAGAPTCDFEVGDATRYAPVTSLAFSSVGTAGALQARTDAGDHPETASDLSGIDAARSVNRYWTLSLPGGSTLAWNDFSGYSAVFNFDAADVDAGASTSEFVITQKSNTIGVWSPLAAGARTATSAAGSGFARATFFFGWAELVTGPYVTGELKKLAEWRMDDATWADSSGNGYTGTGAGLSGAPSTSNASPAVAGSPGTCSYGVFDRASKHYIAVPGAFPDLPTRSFTITAWIRTTDRTQPGQRILIDDVNNAGGWGFSLGDGGAGRLRFFTRGGSSLVIVNSNAGAGNEIQDNTWYFVAAAVFVSPSWTFITLYIYNADGSLRDTAISFNSAYTFGSDAGIASIGGETNPPNPEGTNAFGFAGNIDELRVYRTYLGTTHLDAIRQITRPCIVFDHVRIEHDGVGLTCNPETVTVKACADATCSSLYSGSVTTTLTPAGWVGGDTISFTGSTTHSLRNTTAGSVTLGATATTPAPTGAARCFVGATESCALEFKTTGFIFDVPNLTACKTSGTVTITAVRADDTSQKCVPAFESGTRTVNFWSIYSSPAIGTQQAEVNGTPVATSAPGTGISLAFTTGATSTVTVRYPDAGQLQLNARYSGAGSEAGLVMDGVDIFVSAPVGIGVVPTGGACAAGDATCAAYRKAGEAFDHVVRGACWTSDADTDFSDNPVTPNFQLSGIQLTSNLVAPSGGTNATLGTGSITLGAGDNGTKTVSQTMSEVGVFTITATPPTNGYFGLTVPPGTSANIGRFYPDRFSVTAAGTLTQGCASGPFTYLGQAASIGGISLEAQNASGSKTNNYTGAFAKHTPAAFASWGLAARDSAPTGTILTSRIGNAPTISGSWSGGALTSNVSGLIVGRNAGETPDGPYPAVAIGIAPTDSDGVALANFNVNLSGSVAHWQVGGGTGTYRFGRLRVENAAGQGHLALPIQVTAQYWTGSAFTTNALDGCTTLNPRSFVLSGHSGGITTGNLPSPTAGSDGAVSVTGSLTSGIGNVRFNAPSPAATTPGAVRFCIDLDTGTTERDGTCVAPVKGAMPWLQGAWTSSAASDDDPAGRATYGLFGSQPRNFIFQRENY